MAERSPQILGWDNVKSRLY